MRFSLKQIPRSAILLGFCGIALIICASTRLGHLPSRFSSYRDWKKDPASMIVVYVGIGSIAGAIWLTDFWRSFDNAKDTDSSDKPADASNDDRPTSP